MNLRSSKKVETPDSGVKPLKKKMKKWLKGIMITIGSLLGLFIFLVWLSTCDTTEEANIIPASTAIVGPAGDMFEVVDKPATVFVDNRNVKMSVNLKRISEGEASSCEFGVELIGENDEVLSVEYDSWNISRNIETLAGLRVGEVSSIKFEFITDTKLKAKKIKKFRVISKVKKAPEPVKEKTVDELIDDLVDYVGRASELQKRAANENNLEAVSKIYNSLADLDKPILKITDKLAKAEADGEVTDAQKKRIETLLDKLATVAAAVEKDKVNFSASMSEDDSKEEINIEDSQSNGSKVSSTSSGNEWDKALDEYERYCDELVSLTKKAKSGDVLAMSEYASVVESAEDLQEKLEDAKSKMTANQVIRLNKLSTKMAKSMLDVMK